MLINTKKLNQMSNSKFFIAKFQKSALENYDYETIEETNNPDDFDAENYDCNAVQGFTVVEVVEGKATDYFSGEDIVLN